MSVTIHPWEKTRHLNIEKYPFEFYLNLFCTYLHFHSNFLDKNVAFTENVHSYIYHIHNHDDQYILPDEKMFSRGFASFNILRICISIIINTVYLEKCFQYTSMFCILQYTECRHIILNTVSITFKGDQCSWQYCLI